MDNGTKAPMQQDQYRYWYVFSWLALPLAFGEYLLEYPEALLRVHRQGLTKS
jgi:hypothetical protein